jgi:hypothetical protein
MTESLRKAAQAVLDRWDSPQWEWTKQGPTADLMNDLRRELANEGWQPIETAPKDRSSVDLLVPCYGESFRLTDCFWEKSSHSWFCRGNGRYCPYPPSHWMPPPPPPKVKP